MDKDEMEKRETWRMYRAVFGTEDGLAVLADILNDLGYFASDPRAIDPAMLAEANLILRRIGTNDITNLKHMTEALVQCAPPIGGGV